jgi:hypothetical protein
MSNNHFKSIELSENALLRELSGLIEKSKQFVAKQMNSVLVMLFWHIGKRINETILQNKRVAYGRQIVSTVSAQLENKYGRNFAEKNVRRMMQFATRFPDEQIVVPLARQLSWSHFIILLPIKNQEARVFYAQKEIDENMGKRELRKQIANKAFERTGIANAQLSPQVAIPLNTFKYPYILDLRRQGSGWIETKHQEARG